MSKTGYCDPKSVVRGRNNHFIVNCAIKKKKKNRMNIANTKANKIFLAEKTQYKLLKSIKT